MSLIYLLLARRCITATYAWYTACSTAPVHRTMLVNDIYGFLGISDAEESDYTT